jgi:hypothetical protein
MQRVGLGTGNPAAMPWDTGSLSAVRRGAPCSRVRAKATARQALSQKHPGAQVAVRRPLFSCCLRQVPTGG